MYMIYIICNCPTAIPGFENAFFPQICDLQEKVRVGDRIIEVNGIAKVLKTNSWTYATNNTYPLYIYIYVYVYIYI